MNTLIVPIPGQSDNSPNPLTLLRAISAASAQLHAHSVNVATIHALIGRPLTATEIAALNEDAAKLTALCERLKAVSP